MPRRWKPPKEERTDIEKIRRKKELQQKLAELLEYGTEEDFVQAVKLRRPDVGAEELRALIRRFRDAVREKRGLY
jgi:hypothetical protein